MSTKYIGNRYGFIWSGSTKKTRWDRAVALAPRRLGSIEARCLVKVSVVGRGLSWSCSLWPRNTTPAIVSECISRGLRQRAPAEGERQRRKVDDGNCRARLNWRATDGTDLPRPNSYSATFECLPIIAPICRFCYAVAKVKIWLLREENV